MKKKGHPRGPYAKSGPTKEAILDAALQVFANDGYRKGSLRAIADAVGMSEAGTLHYFPNKNALLAAVLKHNDEFSDGTFDFDHEIGTAVLEEFIRRVGRNATRPGVTQLYATLSAEATAPDHPARVFFVERYRALYRCLRAAFEDMRARWPAERLGHTGERRPSIPCHDGRGAAAVAARPGRRRHGEGDDDLLPLLRAGARPWGTRSPGREREQASHAPTALQFRIGHRRGEEQSPGVRVVGLACDLARVTRLDDLAAVHHRRETEQGMLPDKGHAPV